MSTPPIRREIAVTAEPALAFEVFTADLGGWWPLSDFSVRGEGGTVAFEDGRIVERHAGEPDQLWGSVTAWEPPDRLAFTWHPGHPGHPGHPDRGTDDASQVTVTFTATDKGTLVRLEHRGWEAFANPDAAREEYNHGWPVVLNAFAAHAGVDGSATWVALLHTPGPAAGEGAEIFRDPRFGLHVAFLERMAERGYLVAAGPLPDQPGSGMTVLRLPGADRFTEADGLARTDDASVACGFFSVEVRPWQVMLHR